MFLISGEFAFYKLGTSRPKLQQRSQITCRVVLLRTLVNSPKRTICPIPSNESNVPLIRAASQGARKLGMPTATQYADWVVDYCATELGAPTDPMSLEKQLYYAQGFSLALRGEPLFAEDFEAWTNGPVVRPVWDRYHGSSPITKVRSPRFGSAPPLLVPNDQTRAFLTDLIAFLSRLNALELSRATHNEEPWIEARDGLGPRDYCSDQITKSSMLTYYSALIEEGEDALSRRSLLADLPSPHWGWSFVAGICARRLTAHPFYFQGLALWGAKSRLNDGPEPRAEVNPDVYRPLSRKQAEDAEVFTSVSDFIASLKSQ
jgi:uncharacterized phage-associated protein